MPEIELVFEFSFRVFRRAFSTNFVDSLESDVRFVGKPGTYDSALEHSKLTCCIEPVKINLFNTNQG